MLRPALAYGALIAAISLLLAWMDWRHLSRAWSTEFYVLAIAVLFAAIGIWLGGRLAPRSPPLRFERNVEAADALAISPRELEVLDELAKGKANKVIARDLRISPNTVKTHVARLFEKLEAENRTQAITKARALRLLP